MNVYICVCVCIFEKSSIFFKKNYHRVKVYTNLVKVSCFSLRLLIHNQISFEVYFRELEAVAKL